MSSEPITCLQWKYKWITLHVFTLGVRGKEKEIKAFLFTENSYLRKTVWQATYFFFTNTSCFVMLNTVHLQRLMVLCCCLAFIQSQRQNSVAEHFVVFCIL